MTLHTGRDGGDINHVIDAGNLRRSRLSGLFANVTEYRFNLLAELRPLWRDVSVWQGNINAAVMAANGVYGLIARAAVSWGYQDTQFEANWDKAGAAGLYRSSYHVIYTDQPVQAQFDNWIGVHPEIDVIPRVIDLEVNRGDSYSNKAARTWQMAQLCHDHDGVWPLIYTRYTLANSWLASWSTEQLNTFYWWLAQYLVDRTKEHPGPPTVPQRVLPERVVLHQTADKKAPFPGEVESLSVDWDRWTQGDAAAMQLWIASIWGDEVELTLEQKVDALWNAHPELWP